MSPTSLVDELVRRTVPSARRLLHRHPRAPGLCAAYIDRVIASFVESPADVATLTRHWRAIVELGDDPAQGYRAKGIEDRTRGRWAAAAEAFLAAGRLAKDPVARASLPIGAIDSLARAGRVDDGVRLGRRLAGRLRSLCEDDLAGRALLNAGNALLWADRYREAKRLLEDAIVLLKTPGLAIGARLGLSTCELFGGSTKQALALADTAFAEFTSLDSGYSAGLCQLNRAQAHLLLGRPDQALTDLLQVRETFSGPDLARTEEFLGDAYLRLHLAPEALDAYGRALEMGATPLNRANCLLGLGLARGSLGRHAEAIPDLRRAERAYRRVNNPVWECVAAVERARLDQNHALARRVAARLADIGGPYHRVWSALVCMELSPAPAPAAEVNQLLRRIERGGFIELEWRVHALRARWASPRDRLRSYRRMLTAILDARLLTQSHLGRIQLLFDKAEPIREYLSFLLSRGRAADVDEALEAVMSLRSAALIDEVLTARPEALGPSDRARLEELRTELSGPNDTGGGARRAGEGPHRSRLRRAWRELAHRTVSSVSRLPAMPAPATVFVLGREVYRIADGSSTRLDLCPEELRREVRKIEFDLLEPALNPDADPEAVLGRIRRLSEALLGNQVPPVTTICPDGELWQVPWQACVSALDPGASALLVPTPRFGSSGLQQRLPARPSVVIWAGRAADTPHVRSEVEAVLAAFPQARVCTTTREVLASLEGGAIDLLHAATHGRLDPSNPMFSFLEFEGGRLFAADLAQAGVRPKLVFLAACETARVASANRDEPDGLARAFLALGAEVVVGSQWPLDDASASVLVRHTVAALASGATFGEAIRCGRNEARKLRKHPYFWASMVSLGGFSGT